VSTALTGDPAPDAVVQAVGTIEILDGSSLVSVAWTQEPGGVAVQIANADQETADVTLPGDTLYKDELIKILGSRRLTRPRIFRRVSRSCRAISTAACRTATRWWP